MLRTRLTEREMMDKARQGSGLVLPVMETTPEVQAATYARRAGLPDGYLSRPPRLRFNWGYWDAAALTARGILRPDGLTAKTILDRHPDLFYAHCWIYGEQVVRGQGEAGKSSEPAWQDFLASLTDPTLIHRVRANP